MKTIIDVAELAKVSSTTVSHVINGTRFVSEDLKERVYEAMRVLGYQPNFLARSLRIGQTKTIGLIVPDNSNPFFAEIARFIEDLGYENGYSVILCNSNDDIDKENAYINTLIAKQVDGVIFISSGGTGEGLEKLKESRIPFVVADRDLSVDQADVVLINNQVGGYMAAQYLLSLGHRWIACITGPSPLAPCAQRVNGYYQALNEAGISADPSLIAQGDFRSQGGEAAMNQLLSLEKPPTAVFAFSDTMAIGAILAAHNHGLRVPEDVSIIGFDDIPLAQVFFPSLTTVAQPFAEISKSVMDLLLERIQNKLDEQNGTSFHRIILQPNLVVRNSTCPWRSI